MTASSILVVDDDVQLTDMLCELFHREGWRPLVAHTISAGDQLLSAKEAHVTVLDVMLPDGSGLEACQRWRGRHPTLGIVMLTARGEPIDRILGLEIGADDYLAKPFEPRELVARVRALLRRASQVPQSDHLLKFNGLTINLLSRSVWLHSPEASSMVELTNAEFKLLIALASEPLRVHSRAELGEALQSSGHKPRDRAVDVQVTRLRRKLRNARTGEDWIGTVRNQGYMFAPLDGEK